MRRVVVTALCLIALFWGRPAESVASPPPGLHVGASVSQWTGSTSYRMSARAEDPTDPGSLVDIHSTLEFPLETTLVGVTAGWSPRTAGHGGWTLGAGIHTNLDNPSARVTDEDWVGATRLSYTESDTELDVILATADVSYRLPGERRVSTSILFHLDYQRIEQYVVGYEGWRGSLFSDEQVAVSGTARVIDYSVTYLSGQLGAGLGCAVGTRSALGAKATVGVVRATDTDDHLLRGRISEGRGWGIGAGASATLDLVPGSPSLDWLSVSLAGEVRYFHAVGHVAQRWYRDEDMPAGAVIADLPYEIDSLQFRLSATAGILF